MPRRSILPRSVLAAVVAVLVLAWSALAQDPAPVDAGDQDPNATPALPGEATELDKLAESLEKAKKKAARPPFEFTRNQVAPFDVLPWAKPHHWSTLTLEVRANNNRYEGIFETTSDLGGRPQIPLYDAPRAIVYTRDAFLPADQPVSRSLQVMLPTIPRRLYFELTRPGSIRPDAPFEALMQRLEPHQMLIPVLSPEPSLYNNWSKMFATLPNVGEPNNTNELERLRYYRFVFPMDPTRPNLSPHPLTWGTTSHLIWDGIQPEALTRGSFSQQQALLDWLHWGGQLIVMASGPNVAGLEQSFLGPYLPATVSGQGDRLSAEDLVALSSEFRPPVIREKVREFEEEFEISGRRIGAPPRYEPPDPIMPLETEPVFLARLEPKPELNVQTIRLGDAANRVLAVEHRVGRGRVIMLAFNPNDPAIAQWRGLDTFVRRILLNRPLEDWDVSVKRHGYEVLPGTALSSVRFASRDIGAEPAGNEEDPNDVRLPTDAALPRTPVAAWIDKSSELPIRTRDTLERASGITIPGSGFVLRILLSYIIALVPLNWLISRFVFRRREVAWIIAPLLALGFAYGVERAAAVDLGFEVACDEIDLVEIQGNYPRAHVSRFTSLYSSGRVNFAIAQPDNPTALILPMRSYQSLRGEEVRTSVFVSSGDPTLGDFLVQPRSLAMFRAESMMDLGGGIAWVEGGSVPRVVNGTPLELLDAALIDTKSKRVLPLGTIAPWPGEGGTRTEGAHVVDIKSGGWIPLAEQPSEPAISKSESWSNVISYLDLLRTYDWGTAADQGEMRLVAWGRDPIPGQAIVPRVDRHRGVRLVLAHLKFENVSHSDPEQAPPRADQN